MADKDVAGPVNTPFLVSALELTALVLAALAGPQYPWMRLRQTQAVGSADSLLGFGHAA